MLRLKSIHINKRGPRQIINMRYVLNCSENNKYVNAFYINTMQVVVVICILDVEVRQQHGTWGTSQDKDAVLPV